MCLIMLIQMHRLYNVKFDGTWSWTVSRWSLKEVDDSILQSTILSLTWRKPQKVHHMNHYPDWDSNHTLPTFFGTAVGSNVLEPVSKCLIYSRTYKFKTVHSKQQHYLPAVYKWHMSPSHCWVLNGSHPCNSVSLLQDGNSQPLSKI